MSPVNEKNTAINDGSLADVLVKVLKTMLDRGMISDEEKEKTKLVDVVHQVICNRENEWGENDTEDKLMGEVLSAFNVVG
tara:strand:- start:1005 stop:1244 length:240 start_codon:yes stop_codon:yes gene_type:complete